MKRTHRIPVLVNDEERALIAKAAKDADMTLGAYVRLAVKRMAVEDSLRIRHTSGTQQAHSMH